MKPVLTTIAGLLLGIGLGAATSVLPAPITIDFNDQAGYRSNNFTLGGMQFSPSCAVLMQTPKPVHNYSSNYLLVDSDNNCGANNNQNFLGGDVFASLYLDRFGQPFTFFGLDSVTPFFNSMNFEVISSKGGVFNHTGATGAFDLSGDLWRDVTWVTLRDTSVDSFHKHRGWDNLRIDYDGAQQLPEPGTAWLIGIAGLAAFSLGYKKFFKRTYDK